MIYLGSDHYGYEVKKVVKSVLADAGKKVVDLGVFDIEEQADYPDIAREVAEKIAENDGAIGILLDATGIGMMMAANKIPTVRATVATNKEMARMARESNDANVICVGLETLDQGLEAMDIISEFLRTNFGEKEYDHKCVDKLKNMVDKTGKINR